MRFVAIMNFVFFAFVFLFVITQVVWPLLRNRQLFPFFRKKKLMGELAQELEKQDDLELQKRIDQLRKENTPAEVKSEEVK